MTRRPLRREDVQALEDLPSVGPAIARDLRAVGIATPAALLGRDPYVLYDALNRVTGRRHDPCVLDTFIAAVRFVEGDAARPWWAYTAQRKRELARRARRPSTAESAPAPRGRGTARPTLATAPNLGPVSRSMLAAAGIRSVGTLRRLGAVEAYRRVRARDDRASLNLLWALHGAITGRRWQDVAREDRLALLLQLDGDRSPVSADRDPHARR